MRIKISQTLNAIQKVKSYIVLMFRKDPVRPWDVIRYSADVVICHKLYGASIADYFEVRWKTKFQ